MSAEQPSLRALAAASHETGLEGQGPLGGVMDMITWYLDPSCDTLAGPPEVLCMDVKDTEGPSVDILSLLS